MKEDKFSSDTTRPVMVWPDRHAVTARIAAACEDDDNEAGTAARSTQPVSMGTRRLPVRGSNLKEHARTLRDLTRTRFQLQDLSGRVASQSSGHNELAADHNALAAEHRALQAENQMLRQSISELQDGMRHLKDELHAMRDSLRRAEEAHEAAYGRATREMVRLHGVMDAQRRSYVDMTRQITHMPDDKASDAATLRLPLEDDPFLDIFYREFEDRYRGSREEILHRLRDYTGHLAFLHEIDAKNRLIIDLGCGRGEWLEVLREQGLEAVGIDTNEAQAEAARGLDLKVEIDDAISYLSRQRDRSVDFISAFHLIEHLEFPVLTRLLKEVMRVLKPGGRLLLETPNPESLIVGAYKFWFDPTHVRPYPSELIGQLLASLGFRDIDVLRLHPDGRKFQYTETHGLAEPIADLIVGPLDYAILSRRP